MNQYDVFISYRRVGGSEVAKQVNDYLVQLGYNVSFDVTNFVPGTAFPGLIRDRIKECADFVLVVDPHCFDLRKQNGEDWVLEEIKLALGNPSKNIIPVLMRGASFSTTLPEEIKAVSKIHGIETSYDDWLVKLEKSLHSCPTKYSFKKKGYKSLSEEERHGVYAYYFPDAQSKAYSRDTLFSKMFQCVREMYAFHEYCGYTVDKSNEDWLLSEWLIDSDKVNCAKLGIEETGRRQKTERLANMFWHYREAVELYGK